MVKMKRVCHHFHYFFVAYISVMVSVANNNWIISHKATFLWEKSDKYVDKYNKSKTPKWRHECMQQQSTSGSILFSFTDKGRVGGWVKKRSDRRFRLIGLAFHKEGSCMLISDRFGVAWCSKIVQKLGHSYLDLAEKILVLELSHK